MTDVSAVSTDVPKITAVVKTKSPGRVAQGKKLAAIRAEKHRLREADGTAERASPDEECDRYRKVSFYLTLVSSVAALLSVPFVYRYLTRGSSRPIETDEPQRPIGTDEPQNRSRPIPRPMIESKRI